MPRQDLYRTALQVSAARIAALSEGDLNELMRDLLNAQAYLASANPAEVLVNTQGLAGDGGGDGVSPAPPRPDPWLGDVETVWQFKAGTAGEPARLKKAHEVRKPRPRAALEGGGRFVVIASGSTAGEQGELDRRAALVEDAKELGIPTERIVVHGSESLTNWCNQHPAIAARWSGRPAGLWRIPDWENSDEHDVEWQPVDVQRDAIARFHSELDFDNVQMLHLHVFGHSGVGKSRFVLELCRSARWHEFVVYIRQAADLRLQELLDSCADERDVRVIVVADEVQYEQLLSLRAAVARAGGRVRLVTIGPSASPDPERIPGFEVGPLPSRVVTDVVRRWHPGMPIEHADFVARFSAGYMRLARLASGTIRRNPSMDVRSILEQPQIQSFLDKMLGDGDRSSLHVVSVLTSVGWTDEREEEGRAIAMHLGLDWARVRREVETFERRFHIAPRSGRLRNISPTPLGVYLALEAWSIYPTELRSLPTALSTAAVDAYYERLQLLASSPQAGRFAREELDSFSPAADLKDVRAIRRWSALAHAHPTMATSKMRDALARRTLEERASIHGPARNALVGGLVALAWSSSTFEDAAHSLALLAEAENSNVANNATAEFLQLFSIYFSGTAVPYSVRTRVLDRLLAQGTPELRRLAVRGLARVAARQGGLRIHRAPITRGLPEPEWEPPSGAEHIAAARLGLDQLRAALESRDDAILGVAATVLGELETFLFEESVRAQVLELISAAARVYPTLREGLRRSVSKFLYHDRNHWKQLGADGDKAVETVLRELEDRSPSGRLQQVIGPGTYEDDEAAIGALAAEFAARPDLLAADWLWLTSGEAPRVWKFGVALGVADLDRTISDLAMSPAMGSDGRLVCAYLQRRTEDLGAEWLETWLDSTWRSRTDRADLVLEATWRLTPTDRGATRAIEIVAAGAARTSTIHQLEYNTWDERLEPAALRRVLEALARRDDGLNTALGVLGQRLRKHPDELASWEDVALVLVADERLIRGGHHGSWEWRELAKLLVGRHAREIYAAILRAQAGHAKHHWYLEHGRAAEIVQLCVDADPVAAWEETRRYLEADYGEVLIFGVGFPEGLLDQMDHDAILSWVAEDAEQRSRLVPRFVAKRYGDDTLGGKLIERYGQDDKVAGVFASHLMSGSWVGSSADHWASIASQMRSVVESSAGSGLRRWARQVADILEQMAERDRIQEEEERVRDR